MTMPLATVLTVLGDWASRGWRRRWLWRGGCLAPRRHRCPSRPSRLAPVRRTAFAALAAAAVLRLAASAMVSALWLAAAAAVLPARSRACPLTRRWPRFARRLLVWAVW